MSKTKIKVGFTIACYDKFEEVGVLVDLIRDNYLNIDPVIYVGCNHPEAEEHLRDIDGIDRLCKGDSIEIPQGQHTSEARFDIGFEARVCSIIRTLSNTCNAVNDMLEAEDVEWVVTLHSDSWFLNYSKLEAVFDLLQEREKKLGVFGFDVSKKAGGTGAWRVYVVDFLMIGKADFLRETRLFKFDALSLMAGTLHDAHTALFMQIMVKGGFENVLCYSDYRNLIFWDGKSVFRNRYLAPYCYDKLMDMVHVNIGSFHDNLGQALQAKLLSESSIKGSRVKEFIERYRMADEILMSTLADYEVDYRHKLKIRLTNFEKLGYSKSFKYLERYLQTHSWGRMVIKSLVCYLRKLKQVFLGGGSEVIDVVNLYSSLPEEKFSEYKCWYLDFHLTSDEREKIASS